MIDNPQVRGFFPSWLADISELTNWWRKGMYAVDEVNKIYIAIVRSQNDFPVQPALGIIWSLNIRQPEALDDVGLRFWSLKYNDLL